MTSTETETEDDPTLAVTTLAVTVDAAAAGQRLDRVLAEALPEVSRSRLKALILAGCVVLDGATIADPSQRVKPGQTAEVRVPPPEDATPEPQAMDLVVVFEDAHLMVVDKPAGLVVHPAAGNPDNTLVNALLAHCGDSLSGIGGVRRPGIVHRLDKDTSGLMVVAKTDTAHHGLAEQFAAHSIGRAYQAVVWGMPEPRQGTIAGNIGRSPANRKKMALVSRGGKHAVTHYTVIRALGTRAALVECRLETGRTHQIRVHMASRGHAVVGDVLYGRTDNRRLRGAPDRLRQMLAGFHRHALHAYFIAFTHPASGESLSFSAELPRELNALIASFEVD